MARMNSSVAALALILVASFLLQSQAQPGQNNDCCFSYVQKPIPLKLLASYEVTSSRCIFPAVVFYTNGNRRRCADPQAAWTKDRMANLSENGQQEKP